MTVLFNYFAIVLAFLVLEVYCSYKYWLILFIKNIYMNIYSINVISTHIHTHTYIYIYIYSNVQSV